MELLLLDESVVHGALGGVLLLVPLAWAAWAGPWLRRIELRPRAESGAAALGLALSREGWGPVQLAAGTVSSCPVRIRWRHGLGGFRVEAAIGPRGAWAPVPDADEVAWVRAAVAAA